ncbi:PhzF family phenazine biosynthesis protein [Streptomyces sp. NPDC006326]|uniref:PhzF family phenazine biosynthesis protein n=1 Tax=Streptomyces sp. NPDC006326 TaxID=3156752 RepID=UPI0033B69D8D
MRVRGLRVTVVGACLRDGRGGSPTAVLEETGLGDDQRRSVPGLVGASHAVFVSAPGGGPVSLRFFTSEGELPACGHGTVAALAYLAARAGRKRYRTALHASGRVFEGWAAWNGSEVDAAFVTGAVDLREPVGREYEDVFAALGVSGRTPAGGAVVASVGRARLLVPLTSRAAVAALAPDAGALRAACDRLGLLGCYVHSLPDPAGRLAARMFAPSIGVPEDVANANSTACLAAHLAGQGAARIAVDMGDSLGSPATITAAARPGAAGPLVRLGGAAKVMRVVRLP